VFHVEHNTNRASTLTVLYKAWIVAWVTFHVEQPDSAREETANAARQRRSIQDSNSVPRGTTASLEHFVPRETLMRVRGFVTGL
jgi:hypothetical protein